VDRRSFQSTSAKLNSELKCIHTKNIFSMLDLDQSEESYKNIKKHVEACEVCDRELKKFELENIEIKIHIPRPYIDTETKEIFTREVSEIFKALDLNEKALLRAKIKSKIKGIDTLGVSILKTIRSKKMIRTYAFGAALFFVLRIFFN
jgi:hypothetical protein